MTLYNPQEISITEASGKNIAGLLRSDHRLMVAAGDDRGRTEVYVEITRASPLLISFPQIDF